jgi:hypothetical protein
VPPTERRDEAEMARSCSSSAVRSGEGGGALPLPTAEAVCPTQGARV